MRIFFAIVGIITVLTSGLWNSNHVKEHGHECGRNGACEAIVLLQFLIGLTIIILSPFLK